MNEFEVEVVITTQFKVKEQDEWGARKEAELRAGSVWGGGECTIDATTVKKIEDRTKGKRANRTRRRPKAEHKD